MTKSLSRDKNKLVYLRSYKVIYIKCNFSPPHSFFFSSLFHNQCSLPLTHPNTINPRPVALIVVLYHFGYIFSHSTGLSFSPFFVSFGYKCCVCMYAPKDSAKAVAITWQGIQSSYLISLESFGEFCENKFIILDSAILFKIFLSMVWLPFLQKKRRKKIEDSITSFKG